MKRAATSASSPSSPSRSPRIRSPTNATTSAGLLSLPPADDDDDDEEEEEEEEDGPSNGRLAISCARRHVASSHPALAIPASSRSRLRAIRWSFLTG